MGGRNFSQCPGLVNVRLLLSIEGLICAVLLVRWPVIDPYYNVTYPFPSVNPDPKALDLLLIHPQVEVHSLQMVTDTESGALSLSPLHILPKEPVPFHSNTPVTEIIPSHLMTPIRVHIS